MWRKCALPLCDVAVDLCNVPLSFALPANRQVHLGKVNKLDTHRAPAMGSLLADRTTLPHHNCGPYTNMEPRRVS